MISAQRLRQFPLLVTLDSAFLDELSTIAEEHTARVGEWVFREGDQANVLYYVVSGRVELKMKLDEKRDTHITLNVLNEGDALGWSAIVPPYVYKLGALVVANTTLIRLDGDQLRALLEKYPEQGYVLMQGITRAMASRFDTISEHIPELSTRAAITKAVADVASIVGGILILLLGLFILYAIISGYSESIPVFLFCLVAPIIMVFLAWRFNVPNKARMER